MDSYAGKVTILYVEDEIDVRDGYARALERVSSKLYTAENGESGLKLYKKHIPDIVITDINMPLMNGLEMVKAIKEIDPHAAVVFTTAHSESKYLLEAIEIHADGYLLKPVQKNSLITLIQKIAKNILLEKAYKEQRDILQHIIDSENSISFITDIAHISFASKAFLNFFGATDMEDFNEKCSSILDIFKDSNSLINAKKIQECMNRGNSLYTYIQNIDEAERIANFVDKEGKAISFYVNISNLSDTNFLINFTNITKIEQQKAVTIEKAYRDGLTGVFNRNKFEEIFEYEQRQFKRHRQPLSLAMIDIDHFKNFNDAYGHLIGDEVLIMLAHCVDDNTRESDLFARWGGEEFVILFTNTSLQEALKSVENSRERIEQLEHKTAGKITASFGVTQLKEDDTLEQVLKRADDALYRAKESGRNCVMSIS